MAFPTTGLIQRLVGDDLTAAQDTGCAQWTDRLGAYHMTQATPARQPLIKKAANGIGGHTALRFDGVDDYLLNVNVPTSIGTVWTRMVVVQFTAAEIANGSMILGGSREYPVSISLRLEAGGQLAVIYTGNVVIGTSVTKVGVGKHVITWSHAADGTSVVWLDGTSVLTVSAPDDPGYAVNGLGLATEVPSSALPNGGSYLSMLVAELASWNAVLTAPQRTAAHSATQDTYGITVADYAVLMSVSVTTSATTLVTNQAASLSCTATGGSGSAKQYTWDITSGPSTAASQFSAITSGWATFKPTLAGTYVVRCTVTDTSGSESASVTITATAPVTSNPASMTSTTVSTGWTNVGGSPSLAAAMSDPSLGNWAQSPNNPNGALLEGLVPIAKPSAGGQIEVTLQARKVAASLGSITVKLMEGAVARATRAITSLPDGTFGEVVVTFLAAEIAPIADTAWGSTVGIRLEAKAS